MCALNNMYNKISGCDILLLYAKERYAMPKGSNQKFKLYRLAEIMLEKTDDEHYITMSEIKESLEEYGITADVLILKNEIVKNTFAFGNYFLNQFIVNFNYDNSSISFISNFDNIIDVDINFVNGLGEDIKY